MAKEEEEEEEEEEEWMDLGEEGEEEEESKENGVEVEKGAERGADEIRTRSFLVVSLISIGPTESTAICVDVDRLRNVLPFANRCGSFFRSAVFFRLSYSL